MSPGGQQPRAEQGISKAVGAVGPGDPEAVLAWIKPPGVSAIFAPPVEPAMVASVAGVRGGAQLSSLDELRSDVWETIPEPPMGYAFRSRCEAPGMTLDMLLDGGAVLGLLMEETILAVVNTADP